MNRYEVRWSNGYWKVFDTVTYRSTFVTLPDGDRGYFHLRTDAASAAAFLNTGKGSR